MKLCRTCGQTKPLVEFHRRGNGYQPKCRACKSAYASQEVVLQRYRLWRQEHKERLSVKAKAKYRTKRHDPGWMALKNQRTKLWRETPQGQSVIAAYRERVKGRQRDAWRAFNQLFPEVHRANVRVASAIRKGRLTRPDICEQCGKGGRIEAAHHDYSKPLVVRWLCQSCHRAWDKASPKRLVT